jgi:hypothetical protein
MIALGIGATGAALVVWQLLHLALVLTWSDARTRGASYYALSRENRRRFKRLLRLHALLLSPILTVLRLTTRPSFSQRRFLYEGVAGPCGACSPESFAGAANYRPRPEDVFVVTQMRSGTTWMQHLVYQILLRGTGDLPGDEKALGAVSPWLESTRTIAVADGPLVGVERPARIIKTHLPASLCPFEPQAKYIYVVRQPLACFASCADFVRKNLAGFAPGWSELAAWFQSEDLMWWGTWVSHVAGWQRRAEGQSNVLWIRYEEMANDLESVIRTVADFLDVSPLTQTELAAVAHTCSLDYMRRHADAFEMHPPHLLQAANPFFRNGGNDRSAEVPPAIVAEIMAWARATQAASDSKASLETARLISR